MCYILVSTPDENERSQIKQVVRKDFFNATLLQDAWTMAETVAIAGKVHVDILILSISNEAEDPFYWTAEVMKKQPNIKLILIDETKNFDNLHRSLRCGAIDYLVRPLSKQELQHSIHRSILSLNQISLLHYSTSAITDNIAEQVNQIIEYIHLNYQEPITLDVLAAFSHMHRNYISRIFKEATGMTFTKYLTFYRIEQSKKLLVTTEDSIAAIAEQVGYDDAGYYARIFKRETSYTPNQYRKTFTSSYVAADLVFAQREMSS
ncbi:helix-turn-helix domain-containing protein [Enterococcus casseliflavus]|uniref:response regulator transcription factor n=1 Tax=Enterococcus TaxID=1350 RepID=UPI001C8BDBF2|nr:MULTISPECIES: DNA-binding response regulator [Enterococcus]MBX9121001.1 helix-turn-helix domain-containing protein [Enterococcus sp. K18_3]MBX9127475.1 helix-turn-helix domain-containing protein [Enterococcus casseliflavus]